MGITNRKIKFNARMTLNSCPLISLIVIKNTRHASAPLKLKTKKT